MSQDKAKATFAHTFKNDRTTAKIQIFGDKKLKAVPQGDKSLKEQYMDCMPVRTLFIRRGKQEYLKAGDLVATLNR